MIDTITFTSFLALLPSSQWIKGWRSWRPEGDSGQPFTGYERIVKHDLLGIRLFVQAGSGIVVRVEADLPKLLFGHNGRLITTQAQLDCAFARLRQALQTVCQLASPHRGYHPGDLAGDTATHCTRIDLAWQFDLAPAFVFLALRNAKHTEIHKRKGEWQDETLVFPGTKLRISIYDKKRKERARCEHNVLRFEVQLHDDKIDRHFGVPKNGVLQRLLIDTAYAAYRNVFLGFGSDLVPDPARRGSIFDYVAWVVTKLQDDDPVGVYCLTKRMCPQRSRDFRKKVGLRVPRLVHFSWADILPEGHQPPAVEIFCKRKERKIEELFEQLNPSRDHAAVGC